MNALKCDRCGGYFDTRGDCDMLVGKKVRNGRNFIFADLCSDCQGDLEAFMNGAVVGTNVRVEDGCKIGFV